MGKAEADRTAREAADNAPAEKARVAAKSARSSVLWFGHPG